MVVHVQGFFGVYRVLFDTDYFSEWLKGLFVVKQYDLSFALSSHQDEWLLPGSSRAISGPGVTYGGKGQGQGEVGAGPNKNFWGPRPPVFQKMREKSH